MRQLNTIAFLKDNRCRGAFAEIIHKNDKAGLYLGFCQTKL